MRRVKLLRGKPLAIGMGVVVVILIVTIGVLFVKYRELRKDPSASATAQADQVIKEVGQLYELPTDEQPTVIQIQDITKLKDQAFFDKAHNGDFALIFTKHKFGMLYRQTDNKLINVAPINLQNSGQSASGTDVAGAATAANIKVSILNASGADTRIGSVRTKVQAISGSVQVQGEATAKNTTGTTTVVDVTGGHTDIAQSIAAAVGGSVQSTLPHGETAPTGADIIVVVGKN